MGLVLFVTYSIHLCVCWSMPEALDYLSHITVFLCWHNMCVLASWKYLFKTLHFLNVMPHCHVLYFGCLWFPLIFHFDVLCLFISYVVLFMLSVLNERMFSICAYHGHGRLSHWQLFLNLCFSMLYCTFTILMHLPHCAL